MIDTSASYLTGKLLIAMPGTSDPQFRRSVVYICAHSAAGAMGLVVNRALPDVDLATLLQRVGLATERSVPACQIHYGGPVQPERGFVLHSTEYSCGEATLVVNKGFAMTATMDILQDIADRAGPARTLITLGYSGWGPGQLDQEILDNGWLTVTPGPGLVFSEENDQKWSRAMNLLGIQPQTLSAVAGHA